MVGKIFWVMVLFAFLFTVGCKEAPLQKLETPPVPDAVPETEKETAEQPETTACEDNRECNEGLLCIDGACKALASLYKTDCEDKCSIKQVHVETSDGEKYDLSLGQGSYSYAGALEWRLLKTPNYCKGEDPLVAVNIIKKTTGKIVGEQILTLHKGDTSDVVTHPTIKKVSFTATLADVTESCS